MPAPIDDTLGDFASLKQIMTASPDVGADLIRAYQYVIARFDVDGFRIDTLRYLKGDLALTFGNAVREYALSIGKRNFFTFGEVWTGDSEDAIAHFIGRNTNASGDLSRSSGRPHPLRQVWRSSSHERPSPRSLTMRPAV